MELLHQEDDFFVINKPSGISVHNEPANDVISLLSERFSCPVYAIHRLDKYTSGVLLCTSRHDLIPILQSSLNTSMKQYYAVVRGAVHSQAGEWSYKITDKAEGRRNPQGVKQHRKNARTSYKRLSSNQYFSLLSLTLHSGRQHQIRKHCAIAGHEVIGDTRYGDKVYHTKMRQRYAFQGFLLHAHRLQFSYRSRQYDFSCLPAGWEQFGLSGL